MIPGKKPSRLGKRIIGEEAAAEARQARKGKVHRLGKRVTGDLEQEAKFERPARVSTVPGSTPAPLPEEYSALSVKQLEALLEEATGQQVLRVLASELARIPEPRKTALRAIMAWEMAQEAPRDSVVTSCMEGLGLVVEEIEPTVVQPEGEEQPPAEEGAE